MNLEANILVLFVFFKAVKIACELALSTLNRKFYEDKKRQQEAVSLLGLSEEEFAKTLAYSQDKQRYYFVSYLVGEVATLLFILWQGFGYVENLAQSIALALGGGEIYRGLAFFAILGLLSSLLSLPFSYYSTFVIEERHGFNRQKPLNFFADLGKGLVLSILLGAPLLSGVLWIMMNLGSFWWLWAWGLLSAFSLLTSFIYPTLLAPLFNKFTKIEDGELKDAIYKLAEKVDFATSGIYVMDASRRSSHGNAYFTGVFSKKRIVLFDTLLSALTPMEIVAVLAHELGHFKLHHVRYGLLRSLAFSGLTFYLLSLFLPLKPFYEAFHLSDVSSYGALLVFSLWFGIADFILTPLSSFLSRQNEFAADRFAAKTASSGDSLISALKKLSSSNHSMPISHPLFSTIYFSHPPLLERLKALRQFKPETTS